ncbi:MAG TPA: hypothetical protein VGO07_04590 [Candidatus Saccharimonadales bacterium]|nr:hypothetical protein [Candidatus Saccharimonadales bacterium]
MSGRDYDGRRVLRHEVGHPVKNEFDPQAAELVSSGFDADAELIVFGPLENDLTAITAEDEDPDDAPLTLPPTPSEAPADSAASEAGADKKPEPIRQRLVIKEERGVLTFTLEPDDAPSTTKTSGLTRKWLQEVASEPEVVTPVEPSAAGAAQEPAETPGVEAEPVAGQTPFSPPQPASEVAAVPQTITVQDRALEPRTEAPGAAVAEQQPPAIYIEEQLDDGTVHRTEASPDDAEGMLDNMAQLRKVVRETVSSYQEYPTPGMDAFFAAKGLPSNPVYLLSPAEIAVLSTNLREVGYSNWRLKAVGARPDGSGDQGVFIPALGIAIVANTPANTRDIMQLEYLVAHEKTHAANGHHTLIGRVTLQGITIYDYERVGHAEIATGRGLFVEEGDASSVATEYIKQTFDRPYGVWDKPEPIRIPGHPVFLPPAYAWPTTTGAPGIWTDSGAFAGAALDLVKRVAPTLSASLVEGRSTLAGLSAVERTLDQLRPGLHEELARLPGTSAGMRNGLEKVRRALGRAAWEVV